MSLETFAKLTLSRNKLKGVKRIINNRWHRLSSGSGGFVKTKLKYPKRMR